MECKHSRRYDPADIRPRPARRACTWRTLAINLRNKKNGLNLGAKELDESDPFLEGKARKMRMEERGH